MYCCMVVGMYNFVIQYLYVIWSACPFDRMHDRMCVRVWIHVYDIYICMQMHITLFGGMPVMLLFCMDVVVADCWVHYVCINVCIFV